MHCPQCQQTNPLGAKFCNECGAPLPRPCQACSQVNPPQAKFCNECGTSLSSDVTGTSPARLASPPAPGLASHAATPQVYTPPHLVEKIRTAKSALEGERKQVTVLFADLKGSMELLADRDPEEARQLLDPVLERLMAAVHRYEGTVNQIMGDGIMALFGAPVAHEDHAVRACYAALAMQESVRRYSTEVRRTHGVEVQIRVGLNSGEVVVRAIGNDLHMDYSAIGQTTHLAARIEQLAAPGSIRLTAETLRLAEGLVQVTALGPVPVKGLAEPVEVFELVGASALRRRLQVAAARGLSPFVGRQPELAALQQALERARAGHGQVVAMVGEAGVGKSRLVYEIIHSHHTQGWLVLESASVSYGKATPYFPVLDLLKRYTQVEDRDDTRTIRARVTGQVLTLDEAYGGLLQERRRTLHAGIVEVSETLYGDRLADQGERLAYHAVRGEVWEKALHYSRQAGTRALARSAIQEAVTSFEGALAVLQHLPDSTERCAQAIDLRFDLCRALLSLGAFARIFALLQEAIALAETGHDQQRLGLAYRQLINHFLNTGDPVRALDAGQRALALATRLDNVALQIGTRFALARVYGDLGGYRQAVDICRHIVATLTDDVLQQLPEALGPGATRVRTSMALNLAELGAFAEGLVDVSDTIPIAQAAHDVFSLADALRSTGYLYLLRGDLPHAIPLLAQSLDVCQTGEVYLFLPRVMAYLGYAYALAGRLPEALPLLEQAQAIQEQARATGRGSLALQARIVALLSEAYGLAGRLDDARQGTARALSLARTHGERGSEAWTLRLLGDLAAQEPAGQGEAAASYYAQALALAEEPGMRPLQAHCQHGLGTLYARQGQQQQARAVLAAAIDLYRDMEMTFWLPQAEAALAQVG